MKALHECRPLVKSAVWSLRRGIRTSHSYPKSIHDRSVFNESHFADHERRLARKKDEPWLKLGNAVAPPNRADVARTAMAERKKSTSAGDINYSVKIPKKKKAPDFRQYLNRIPKEHVIYVRNLNQNLTREDFRRTIPQYMHSDDLVRVIACRLPRMGYQRTNNYYIIFSNSEARNQWRQWIERMARDARNHTMETLQHPSVPPPPSFYTKGIEVDSIVKGWTLSPPRQLTNATDLEQLVQFEETQVLQRGGYSINTSDEGQKSTVVLLEVQGAELEQRDLLQAIAYDGVRRNMTWAVWRDIEGILPVDQFMKYDVQKVKKGDHEPQALHTRWRIRFADPWQADQFARAWHARPFPWPPSDYTLSPAANHLRIMKANNTHVNTEACGTM